MSNIEDIKKLSKIASVVANKLDNRMEAILEEVETMVKNEFPAKYVSASLTRLKKILKKEGIECAFDYKVTRTAIRKTANSDITKDECDEAIKEIAKAIVAETEDTIDQCGTAIDTVAEENFKEKSAQASKKIKRRVQARMNRKGLHFKF